MTASAERDFELTVEAIKDFPWHNYGLDVVSEIDRDTDEWARDLAGNILAIVNDG